MIKIKNITIKEFRGIRSHTLNLEGKNFSVAGRNGTGKSGIVDAIEFALTGNISRLSGDGMGEVSLKQHAPHVDSRKHPERAKVKLSIIIPTKGNKEVIIERNISDPNNPTITPNTPEILEVMQHLENHPEFVLSRREIISYILTPPGKRSEEIQTLLRLNRVGETRKNLKTIKNDLSKKLSFSKETTERARENLTLALGMTDLSQVKLLEEVNKRRKILDLEPIESFSRTIILDDGLSVAVKATPVINKADAISNLRILKEQIKKLSDDKMVEECKGIREKISGLKDDPVMTADISREDFLRTAMSMATEDLCPVCDTEWDVEKLKRLVESKLNKLEEASKIRSGFETSLIPAISILGEICNGIQTMESYAKIIAKEHVSELTSYREDFLSRIETLKKFVPVSKIIIDLENITVVPTKVTASISTIEAAVAAIPDSKEKDQARDYLRFSQERLKEYRTAVAAGKGVSEHSKLSEVAYNTYVEESDKILDNTYQQVQDRFSEFYKSLNSDDEKEFTAKLTPSIGKLGFGVNFYGRGEFPPGAYHSEGHQDAMGLCLYLALMEQLQGKNFTFSVLDDVLMSVDTGHRRKVSKLLQERFKNVQFVLTTHDEVWLKHMKTSGLVKPKNTIRFSDWTPESGPAAWDNTDVWEDIEGKIKKDDIQGASASLRNYLEFISKEICHDLRALVGFRGDGKYDLGQVLPPAIKRFRELLNKGQQAAESWGDTELAKKIKDQEKAIGIAFDATNTEQWQVNATIHYNEWANFSPEDFTPVVEAFKNLVALIHCKKCGSTYSLSGSILKPDTLRCSCTTINLKMKEK